MAFGLKITNSVGVTILDTSKITFSFIDSIDVPGGSSGSKSYPDLPGWVLHVSQIQDSATGTSYGDINNFTKVVVSITYPGGIPTISWSSVALIGVAQSVTLFVMGN